MRSHLLLLPLIILLLRPACGFDIGVELFKEILNFPLRANPFFAKLISLNPNLRADGIEDTTEDYSGNVCQLLGNLQCSEDGGEPQCSGLGVIDCAGDCVGTEEEFKKLGEVLEDKDFSKKFPQLSKFGKKEKQMAATDKVKEIPIEGAGVAEPEPEIKEREIRELESKEPEEDVQTQFVRGLLKCTNFSQETKALLSLADPDGGGGIGFQNTSDPNSKTFVDKSALSDISEVEYDYSDLYDEEDEEEEVRGRELNEETTTTTTTTSPKAQPLRNVKKMASKTEHTNHPEWKNSYPKSLNELDSDEGGAVGHRAVSKDPAVQKLTGRLRWKRAAVVGAEARTNSSTSADPFACVVKNMTCNKFPSRRHCTGVAVGRCGSSTDMLVDFLNTLFTPNVVTATIVALLAFIAIVICLSYYCYKLKANKVMPDEENSNEEDSGSTKGKENAAAENTG